MTARTVCDSLDHLLARATELGVKPHRILMGEGSGDRMAGELDAKVPGWDHPRDVRILAGWQRVHGGKYKAVEIKVCEGMDDIRLEITDELAA